MLHLTPNQFEILCNIVQGNKFPVDNRSVAALQRRGLVITRGPYAYSF